MTIVALRFVERINARDIEGIREMMTADHRFVDSLGAVVEGRDRMGRAWEQYFRMAPDYHIDVEETFSAGPVVILVGTARGTYAPDGVIRAENAWETPAAWRAVVKGDRVAEWRIFADNEPMRRIMAANPPANPGA